MNKSSNSSSRSRRTPSRQRGSYRPPRSIQEGFAGMSMHDSANQATQGGGLGSFLAGTPSKRSSQTPKRTNTPNGRVNNPTQTESNTTRHTNGASSTSKFRNAPNSNGSSDEKPTDTKANGPIRIATSGFVVSEEDEEIIEEDLDGEVVHYDKSSPNLHRMTILVVSANNTTPLNPRTAPFVFAMATGTPIVRHEWLQKSLKEEEFLPTDHYLIKNGVAEVLDISEVNETVFPLSQGIANGIKASIKGGILAGHWCKLCPGIGETPNEPSKKELIMLLKAAGADILTNCVLKGMDGDLDNLIVITSTIATDEQVELANKFVDAYNATRVTCELIIQMLLKQSLDPLEKLKPTQEQTIFTFPGPGKVLYSTKLVDAYRTLSRANEGNSNRGKLGEGGTICIVESGTKKYVHYFDRYGTLKFKALVPAKFVADKEMFGNAGEQDCLVWEADNVAGNGSGEILNRRFFFWFDQRSQLDMFLVTLFGIDIDSSKNQGILEEWYDENGRFYQGEEVLPAHVIVKDENEMDQMEDEMRMRKAAKPRAAVIAEHGHDTSEASQMIG